MKHAIISICFMILAQASRACGAELLVPAQFPTIQSAIDAAVDGDNVIIVPGTYTGPGNRDISFRGKAIIVSSIDPNDPDIVISTIIDCNASLRDSHRGFIFDNNELHTSVLSGVTIINGDSSRLGGGGAIFCRNSNPTILNCRLISNQATFGGAIACFDSNAIISQCVIQDNYTEGCGSIGGGIYCRTSNLQIYKCIIAQNNSHYESGGGIACQWSNCIITECLIYGNKCGDRGGGIAVLSDSNVQISSCTIAQNQASEGGSIYVESSKINVRNSILWGNLASQGNEIALYGGWETRKAEISLWYCDIQDGQEGIYSSTSYGKANWEEGNIDENPEFKQEGYWDNNGTPTWLFDDFFSGDTDYHIPPDSRCVNAGDPNYTEKPEETDIEGNQRVEVCRIDMGAYEFNPQMPSIALSDSKFVFTGIKEIQKPEPQVLQIQNCSGEAIYWRVAEDCPWLKVHPTFGRLTEGVNRVRIYADTNNLQAGTYQATLKIFAYNAISIPSEVNVVLQLNNLLRVPRDFETIQAAIDEANDYDLVIVADGVYAGNGNRDIDFMGKAITVRSENGPENCVIDCCATPDSLHRAFIFQNGESKGTVLDGFTITNGFTNDGGAIYCFNTNPLIRNCIFRNNTAGHFGGAIKVEARPYWPIAELEPAVIYRCSFIENSAGYAGGAISSDSLPLNLTDCTFLRNSAASGGALNLSMGPLENLQTTRINNCDFIDNFASNGGAIFAWFDAGGLYITNSSIIGNKAVEAGAIRNETGNITLLNCLIVGNRAELDTAAILFSFGSSQLINCTIAGNSSAEGNVLTYLGSPDNSMQIRNCILANDGNEIDTRFSVPPVVTYSNVRGGWPGEGNIDMDPCFVLPGYLVGVTDLNTVVEPNDLNTVWMDGDYHLLPDSPCIDAGDPNYVPEANETDLEGGPRVVGGRIDMGAYEYISPVEVEVDITPDVLNLKSKGQWINCKITLPEGYSAKDVDTKSILLEEQIEPECVMAFGCSRLIFAKFDMDEVQSLLDPGEIELMITGQFKDGTPFEGSDIITVIGPSQPHQPRPWPNARSFGRYHIHYSILKGH